MDDTADAPADDLDEARSFFTDAVPVGAGTAGFPPPPPAPPPAPPTAPLLPQAAAKPPPPATPSTPANPFATNLNGQYSPTPGTPTTPAKGGFRRAFSWLLVLAVLGGLAYGAYAYGPELMELASGEETVDETSAPLVFPVPTSAPTPIRTATFEVEAADDATGMQQYEITTDFETGVARVLVERPDAADLEVLTLFDEAVVRRVDQPNWYRIDRGAFPIDTELGRARWVRTLDELLPPQLRATATIERATESTVGTSAARRLLVTLDPGGLDTPAPAPVDGAATPPSPALAPGVTLDVGTDPVGELEVELWVDSAGVVRKSVMPPALGGETITVVSTSPEAWLPVFPTPEMVRPLTASTLFTLGL